MTSVILALEEFQISIFEYDFNDPLLLHPCASHHGFHQPPVFTAFLEASSPFFPWETWYSDPKKWMKMERLKRFWSRGIPSWQLYNISHPKKVLLKMISLFLRWDMRSFPLGYPNFSKFFGPYFPTSFSGLCQGSEKKFRFATVLGFAFGWLVGCFFFGTSSNS